MPDERKESLADAHDSGSFVSCMARALLHEPWCHLTRVVGALVWVAATFNDREYLHALVKEWGVAWAPSPLSPD